MKTNIVKLVFFFLNLFIVSEGIGQTVDLCITINSAPMPASRSAYICRKNSVTADVHEGALLQAINCSTTPETNITITWKNLDVPPYTDSLDNTIWANEPGRWEVRILNNVSSVVTKDTVFLSYPPLTSIAITNAASYLPTTHGCPLDNFVLTTNPTGPITGYQWYTYSPKTILPGATASTHKIFERGVFYIVDARDAYNCIVSDTSNSSFAGKPTGAISLGPDPTSVYCEKDSFTVVNLIPSGKSTAVSAYQWGINNTPKGTVSNAGPPPITISDPPPPVKVALEPGVNKVWLKIFQFPICENIDTIVVIARPAPVVDLPAGPLDTCYAANTTLTPTISVGTAPYTYTWSSVPASSIPSTASVVVSPTANTKYKVTVTDVYNCSFGIDSVVINVNPEIITTASPDVVICRYPTDSTTITASATGGTGAITYQWFPPVGLSTPGAATTKAFPITTRTYTVTSTDGVGCTDTEDVIVTSYIPPVNGIQEPQIINEDYSTTLEAAINAALPTLGNNGASFEWTTSINNIPFSTSSNIYLEYTGPDTVWYVVKVTNPTPVNGSGLQCYVTDTIEIRSISNNTLMYVPNVFSPNAIDPTNQTIKIYSTNILPDGFKWLIFNKWGNLMYETTDLMQAQSVGWDGGAQIEGVYSYVIVGKFKNEKDLKESEAYKGTFTLIK